MKYKAADAQITFKEIVIVMINQDMKHTLEFGESKRCIRVARGATDSSSSFFNSNSIHYQPVDIFI